jgi:DNA-binding NtrC family response regulator
MADILVVDDEVGIRELLAEILGDEGHTVLLAEGGARARALRDQARPDLVLLDIWMPDQDGLTVLREWVSRGQLTMPVIMMSGHATIDTAVEATRIGALDFLEKPIALQKLLRSVASGLERGRAGPIEVPSLSASMDRFGHASAARDGLEQRGANPGTGGHSGALPGASLAAGGASHNGTNGTAAAVATDALPLDLPLREARDVFERVYFEHHLVREQGSMTRVAERTGLERTHLYRKLKQLGIDLTRGAWRRIS